jgi:hypothetical protein
MSLSRYRLLAATAVVSLLGACSGGSGPSHVSGGAGSNGSGAGGNATGIGGSTGTGTGGDNVNVSGTAGQSGTGTAGDNGSGTGGSNTTGIGGTTGTGGVAAGGSDGTGTAGAAGGATGTAGGTGTGGMLGASSECSPPPPRAINVTDTKVWQGTFNGQPLYFNGSKKAEGKLFLLLPGIGNGPGAGGFESFVELYGFHVFGPKTNTSLTGGSVPQMYKDTIKTDPTNREANRQVGDARTDEWDGKGRVTWNTVTVAQSMQQETIDAIKYAEMADPGGDWGFFLNADGTLRTTDVYVVGYSWGAQTWSMISTYVRFGKVIAASGPVNEGFPNGTWMTDTSATPVNCKYALVADSQATEIFPNVQKAMWPGDVVMVHLADKGPYTDGQHLFEMIGGDGGTSPGGHTVFCNSNPANQWWPVCKHVLGEPP